MEEEGYSQRFKDAHAVAVDGLEEEARRRAVEGVRRYKFDKGAPVLHPETRLPYFEHEYSDALLIFLLKGAKPDVYRERVQVGGGVLNLSKIDVSQLTDEQVRRLAAGEDPLVVFATTGPG
jgi:hypothetical protein